MSDVDRMPSDTITATATQNIRGRQDAFRYIHCYSHTEYQKSKGYLPIHSLLEPHRMSEVDRMPSDTFTATATQNIRRRQDVFRYIHCYSHTECQMSTGCLPIHSLLQPHWMLEFDRMPSDTFTATATQNMRRRQDAFRYIHCYSHTEYQTSTGCLPIHSLLQPHRISDVERMPSDTFTATATQNVGSRQDAFRYIHCYSHTDYQTSTSCLPIHSLLQPHRMSDVERMPSDTFTATATQNVGSRQDAFRYIHCYSHTEYQTSTGCLPIRSLLQPPPSLHRYPLPHHHTVSTIRQHIIMLHYYQITQRTDAFILLTDVLQDFYLGQ